MIKISNDFNRFSIMSGFFKINSSASFCRRLIQVSTFNPPSFISSRKTQEWLTKESSRPPQDNKKNNLRRVFKWSKSLNDISTINQTKLDNQPSEQQNTTEKHPGRNKAARTKRPITKRIKKFQSRQDRRLLLRNKGIIGPGAAAQIYQPEPYWALKNTTKPENGLGLVSTAPENQDAAEMAHSFSEQISKTQSNSGKCTEVVSPVLKLKIVQHHPTEDVMQDNKVVLLSVSSKKCDVSGSGNDQAVRLDKDASRERPGSPEELEDQRIYEPAGQTSSECAEHNIQASTPFAPLDIRAGLEKMTQHMHQGFAGNQGFVSEISRILSEILGSLQRWTSDVENILKNKSVNESRQHNKEQTGHVMEPTLTKHVERSLTGPSAVLRDHSASRMLEVTSTSYPDIPGHLTNADRKAQRIMSKTHEMEGVELSGGTPADTDETTVIGCPEPLVFINSYFTKPEEATAVVSRSNPGSSTSPKRLKSQSCRVVSVKYSKELKTCQSPSKVRKVLDDSSEEIKILDVSELPTMSLQERRSRIEKSARSSGDLKEELSVGHMDSCEEVREEQNDRQRVMEAVVEDGEVVSVANRVKHQGGQRESCSGSRKDKKSECSIS